VLSIVIALPAGIDLKTGLSNIAPTVSTQLGYIEFMRLRNKELLSQASSFSHFSFDLCSSETAGELLT